MHQAADQKISKLDVHEKFLLGSDLNRTNASAISVDTPVTLLESTGAAETRTLPQGREGQKKILICTTYVGDIVVTPTNLRGYTTITFAGAGSGCELAFYAGEWHVIGVGYATLA